MFGRRAPIVFCIFVITVLSMCVCGAKNGECIPFQIIDSEPATLNRKGSIEHRGTFSYETGYIPAYLMRYGLRYGLLSRLEGGFYVEGASFPNQNNTRLSALSGTIKAQVIKARDYDLNLYTYIQYRHSLGESIVRRMYSGEEAGLDNDIIKMVSPHADEGQDATLGILSRNAHKRGRHPILYMVGLMYTYMDNREYGDYEENQKHMVTLNYTPEFHVREYKLMFALENNLHYWHNRGYYVTTLPQLRWEFIPFWVIEIGVKVPVAGENNYRYIIGINQGKG